jgi:hypothetical protein
MSWVRASLVELAAASRMLHRQLLLVTQKGFEKLYGRVEGPGALLQLAVHDPLFAWLRPLSQQTAALDELAATDEVTGDDLDAARARLLALLEAEGEFRATYVIYLQADPEVVLAHAALRRLLGRGGWTDPAAHASDSSAAE